MTREPTAARGRRGSFRGKNPVRGGRRFTNPQYYKGGTAEDPLNLSNVGLEDDEPEEVVDEVVEIFVPKNPRDPLNLNASSKRKYEKNGDESLSPCKKVSKVGEPEPETSTATDDEAKKKKDKKEYFNRKYHYGNFDKYYGVRLGAGEKDPRISSFKKEWFEKKSVLDIGCNVGFLTLSIAKEFGPRRILGIDIDEHLVGVARKNIRHYCDAGVEFTGKFPASFAKQLGPISGHTLSFSSKFPDNTWFRRENYVLSSDEELELVEPEFDVILALSITKWIHLNFGDDGMRRFFLRAFRQLLPGGRFILEPQPFDSYRKRAKMLPELMTNYKKTEFKPQDFETYLLETVGFRRVEHVGAPCAKTKGFERPIDVYVKPMPGSSRPTPSSSSAVASPATDTGSSATDVETVASSSTAASPASAP